MSNNLLPKRKGILFVLSSPSGAGKSTVYQALKKTEQFAFSISCTTRPPRTGETDGIDYHFLSEKDFAEKVAAGDFLEHAKVHRHRYGTLATPVIETLRSGRDMLMDIDTAGADSIRNHPSQEIREALADIFLLPPCLEELERRLLSRGTESPEDLATRLKNAEEETARWQRYRYVVPNRSVEENIAAIRAIFFAERCIATRYPSNSFNHLIQGK